eukprot:IDg8309t1
MNFTKSIPNILTNRTEGVSVLGAVVLLPKLTALVTLSSHENCGTLRPQMVKILHHFVEASHADLRELSDMKVTSFRHSREDWTYKALVVAKVDLDRHGEKGGRSRRQRDEKLYARSEVQIRELESRRSIEVAADILGKFRSMAPV